MTTKKQTLNIINNLLDAYPHYKPRSVHGLVDLWYRKFKDTEFDILQEAIDLHIDSSKYFPSIHEVKSHIPVAEYNILNRDAADLDKSALDEMARIDWENATDEAREFWTEMMEADGREMVSPGVWGPVE